MKHHTMNRSSLWMGPQIWWLLRVWIAAVLLGVLFYDWFWHKDPSYNDASSFWGDGHLMLLFLIRLVVSLPALSLFLLGGQFIYTKARPGTTLAEVLVLFLLLVLLAADTVATSIWDGTLKYPPFAGFLASKLLAGTVALGIMELFKRKEKK